LKEYPLFDNTIRFIFIGRIMIDKGINELFELILHITSLYSNVYFDIVGECEENYIEQIKKLESLPYVRYHGLQNDVHPFIKSCHATILPSYHEGLANVLLETAATGRPILASKISGCLETFDEGVSGLGFEAHDITSLINSVKFVEMPYDKKKAMGIAGRQKVEKEFNRQIIIDTYLDKIEKAITK
jgi:galacturonosyltransferase